MFKGIHLSLMIGPGIPIPVPREVVEALVDVQVSVDARGPSGFQLTFNLSNRSPLNTIFLLSGGSLPPVMRVVIIATINAQTEVLMDGVMTRHEVSPGNRGGMSTLTVTGEDLSRVMDYLELDGFPFPGQPAFVRVAGMIAKYAAFGMIPLVVPPVYNDVELPIDKVPLQKGTDLTYIWFLAHSVGHVFYVEPGPVPLTSKAYWGPEIRVGIPQPALNVDMDSHRNVESLNFSFSNDGQQQLAINVSLPFVPLPVPVPIPDVSLLNPPLGAIPPVKHGFKMIPDTSKLSMTKALLRGLSQSQRAQEQVVGSGTLDVVRYGRILKARRLVGVRGAGRAYDGLYYVRQVTHRIRRGEYKQSFTLTRNGLVSTVPKVPV